MYIELNKKYLCMFLKGIFVVLYKRLCGRISSQILKMAGYLAESFCRGSSMRGSTHLHLTKPERSIKNSFLFQNVLLTRISFSVHKDEYEGLLSSKSKPEIGGKNRPKRKKKSTRKSKERKVKFCFIFFIQSYS